MLPTDYRISYFSAAVEEQVLDLPDGLAARYVFLTRRLVSLGPDLGLPHTRALGNGLFELRLRSAEGIARAFYCIGVGRQIVVLHCLVKKTPRTPVRDLRLAERRMKEIRRANA
jgi:phage-related protein